MIIDGSRTCRVCGWTLPVEISGLVAPCVQCELAASLEPFTIHNTSEPTLAITVRSEDVRRARAALYTHAMIKLLIKP